MLDVFCVRRRLDSHKTTEKLKHEIRHRPITEEHKYYI